VTAENLHRIWFKCRKAVLDKKGFSLIEAALTIAVLGALITAFLPTFVHQLKADKSSLTVDDVRTARDELTGYIMINQELPTTFSSIGHIQDSYNNGLQYANASVENICNFIASGNNTGLKVTTIDGTTVDDIVFIVASMGDNDVLDTDMNASTVKIYKYGETSAYSGNAYDDVVEYVTLSYLASKVDCP